MSAFIFCATAASGLAGVPCSWPCRTASTSLWLMSPTLSHCSSSQSFQSLPFHHCAAFFSSQALYFPPLCLFCFHSSVSTFPVRLSTYEPTSCSPWNHAVFGATWELRNTSCNRLPQISAMASFFFFYPVLRHLLEGGTDHGPVTHSAFVAP